MKALIEALTIFSKYGNEQWPTHCEHDSFAVLIDPILISSEDIARLEVLGFHADYDEDHFYSYRFGSA